MNFDGFYFGEILDSEQGETFSEGTIGGEPYIDVRAKLFKEGVKRGSKTYGAADLAKMVSTFSKPQNDSDWTVPIQLDHSESARDSLGNVREVSHENKRLLGTLRFVGAEPVSKVKSKVWRRLSIGLRPDGSLRETSVTPFPYVNDASTFREEADMADNTQTQEAHTQTAAQAATQDQKGDAFSERLAELERQFAEKTKSLEGRLADSEARNAKQEELIRFTERIARVDKFTDAGKTVANMREKELEFVKSLSDEQMAKYCEVKELQPKLVDLTVRGYYDFKQSKGTDGKEADPEDEADDMAAEFGIPQQKTKAKK